MINWLRNLKFWNYELNIITLMTFIRNDLTYVDKSIFYEVPKNL